MSTKREFDTIFGVGLKLYMAKEDPVMHLCIFIHSSLASDYLHFHRFVSARHLHRLMFLSRVFVSLRFVSHKFPSLCSCFSSFCCSLSLRSYVCSTADATYVSQNIFKIKTSWEREMKKFRKANIHISHRSHVVKSARVIQVAGSILLALLLN